MLIAAGRVASVMFLLVQPLGVPAEGKPHNITGNGVDSGYHRPRLMPRNNQALIQKKLQYIVDHEGLPQALEALQSYSYSSGYLKPDAHTGNPVTAFKIGGYNLDFRYQVNILRSKYVPKYGRAGSCPICWDVVESKQKPGLRAYELTLNGRKWFLQNPPFPYTFGHVVMIDKEHGRRMAVREQTLTDGMAYLDLDPEATFCSNSSYYWSSVSIPEHHHYQIVHERISGGGKFPVLNARPKEGASENGDDVRRSVLDYPLPVIRLESTDREKLVKYTWGIIQRWEARAPGRNSVNIFMEKIEDEFKVWTVFRSTDFRNPKSLRKLKSEPLGYLEVGGEFILPIVTDPKMNDMLANDPAGVFRKLLKAINPLPEQQDAILEQLLKQPLPTEKEIMLVQNKDKIMEQVKAGKELKYSQVKQRSRRCQKSKKMGA